jgi:hypothetical protein
MGCKFFDKQRVDTAGILGVRLEKLLMTFFFLSFIGLGINIAEMVIWKVVLMGPLLFTMIAWFVWWLGWRGATQRKTCALLAYFIFTLIGAIFQLIGFFLTSVGGSLITVLLINQCAEDTACPQNVHAKHLLEEYPWIIAVIFIFSIVVYIIPLFMNIIGLFLSMAMRKELLAIQKNACSLNLQEQGACGKEYKVDSYVVKPEQQEQQPELSAPVFYAASQNTPFVHQGYLPLAISGNNGETPTVIYVPYPAQQ